MAALEARVARLIRDPATDRLEAEARALSGSLAGSGPALALLGEIARRRGDAAAPELLSRAVERSPGLVAAWHALALARVRGATAKAPGAPGRRCSNALPPIRSRATRSR